MVSDASESDSGKSMPDSGEDEDKKEDDSKDKPPLCRSLRRKKPTSRTSLLVATLATMAKGDSIFENVATVDTVAPLANR
jgi:hypothetical protein